MAVTDESIIFNTATTVYDGETILSNEVEIQGEKIPPILTKSTTFTGEWKKRSIIPYKILYKNNNAFANINAPFADVLDVKTAFLAGSFRVDGVVVTPLTTTPAITYTFTSVPANTTIKVEFNVTVL